MLTLALRALVSALILVAAETLNGIFRIRVLNRRLGGQRAKRLSTVLGCIWIFLLAWFLVPWVAPASVSQAWVIGFIWLAVLLAYDVVIGRWAFGLSWRRIAADFDWRKGNYLALGMLFLLVSPYLVWMLR